MFSGSLFETEKVPLLAWEKSCCSITVAKYVEYLVPLIVGTIQSNSSLLLKQNGSSSRTAGRTQVEISQCRIQQIDQPSFSQDLNTGESIKDQIKAFIDGHYLQEYCSGQRQCPRLREIVEGAWNSTMTVQIFNLTKRMSARCQAAVDVYGGRITLTFFDVKIYGNEVDFVLPFMVFEM